MQNKTHELDAKIRQSFEEHSILDVRDYDRMSDDLKGKMRFLNKMVEKYLNAGIPWAQIKQFLLGATQTELGMNLERSLSIVNLNPSCFLAQFGLIDTRDHRLYNSKAALSVGRVNGDDLLYFSNVKEPSNFSALSHLNALDMLKIAKMRVDIDRIPDEKKRQKKIQEMFMCAMQLDDDAELPPRAKQSYKNIWKNKHSCTTAFSALQHLERGQPISIRMEDSEYNDWLLLAAHRINNVEFLIKESAHTILGVTLSNFDYVQQKVKAAELWKDSGLSIPKGIFQGTSTRLPRGTQLEDWDHLHRNTFFKRTNAIKF